MTPHELQGLSYAAGAGLLLIIIITSILFARWAGNRRDRAPYETHRNEVH